MAWEDDVNEQLSMISKAISLLSETNTKRAEFEVKYAEKNIELARMQAKLRDDFHIRLERLEELVLKLAKISEPVSLQIPPKTTPARITRLETIVAAILNTIVHDQEE